MNEHPSAWQSLVDHWVEREARLRPDEPIRDGSVQVRDCVEVGDQAYVLVSYDIDNPWPTEEDAPGDGRMANTAVLQAARVRTPWAERDATRSHVRHTAIDGSAWLHEHLLTGRRAWSGAARAGAERVRLEFEDGEPVEAPVVDGWFLAVVSADQRIRGIAVDGGEPVQVARTQFDELFAEGSGADQRRGEPMYFSPLDLRSVLPIVCWERSGDTVVVASSLEQYDEGGIVRLRIDGIRLDEDALRSWPRVSLSVDGAELASGICGEYALGDTMSVDIGFRPWLAAGSTLQLQVEDLRGPDGRVRPMTLDVAVPASAG